MLHNAAAQSCSTPFQAVFAGITTLSFPLNLGQFMVPDPNFTFYRETLRFTDAEIERELASALQHFTTQFGLNFSTAVPDERGERILGNATFRFKRYLFPFSFTAIENRWLVTGNTNTKCYTIGAGGFQVSITGDMTLFGVYGGEEGKPVQADDSLNHGYLTLNTCAQQTILFQAQSNVPGRNLPVEGWFVEEFVLYNRQLGMGRVQSVYKNRFTPTAFLMDIQQVYSFP